MSESKPVDASAYEKILPFGQDLALRNEYINYFGDIRFGKLLEELDLTAGIVSYNHADGFALDLGIVTAACDRIDLLAPMPCDQDLKILASVNWVGRSSMEIGMRMESKGPNGYELVARAYFIMVARKDNAPHPIHTLQLLTEEDQRRFAEAKERQEQRRRESQTSYWKHAPTADEITRLHELFLKIKNLQIEGVVMSDTLLYSTLLMHPQERNIHNKIFGGHLMRESFELAWSIANIYTHQRPLFVCMDHMDFIKPVEIGSILSFSGRVVYSGTTSFLVEIIVEVILPMTGDRETTNVSYYTFVSVDANKTPLQIPQILPYSYEEGLRFLDGAKRYKQGKAIRQLKGN